MMRKHVMAVALAATLSTGIIASVATSVLAAEDQAADTDTSSENQAAIKTAEKDFVKVSSDTQTGMRDVHGARLAIFNGDPEQARTYVDAAVTRMEDAVKDANKYALDIKAPKDDDSYVPFNANLALLNAYEPNTEQAKQIAKAKAHIHKGMKREAVKELKLAEIDVAVTASMVPVKFAKEHVEQAAKLVAEHKYYAANLALKAVDDAVVVETYAIDAVPKTKGQAESS
ncbi:MAG: YfdX family protein [Candidatus Thiodiazotropha sp.]